MEKGVKELEKGRVRDRKEGTELEEIEGRNKPKYHKGRKENNKVTNKHSRERKEIERKEEIGDDGVLQG